MRCQQAVGLRGYAQRDPLVEYKLEGYNLFLDMMASIRRNTIYNVYMFQPAKVCAASLVIPALCCLPIAPGSLPIAACPLLCCLPIAPRLLLLAYCYLPVMACLMWLVACLLRLAACLSWLAACLLWHAAFLLLLPVTVGLMLLTYCRLPVSALLLWCNIQMTLMLSLTALLQNASTDTASSGRLHRLHHNTASKSHAESQQADLQAAISVLHMLCC